MLSLLTYISAFKTVSLGSSVSSEIPREVPKGSIMSNTLVSGSEGCSFLLKVEFHSNNSLSVGYHGFSS